MNRFILPLVLSFLFIFPSSNLSAQAVNITDSMALVDLYNSTNGQHWTNHTNWLTSAPLSTWYGIFLEYNSIQVAVVALSHNNLVGPLPSSIGNLTDFDIDLDFSDNLLSGSIPTSFTNLSPTEPFILRLARNQLSGPIPQFHGQWPPNLDISYNNFTLREIEPYAISGPGNFGVATLTASVEADLPLIQNGNILTIAAGGTLANNTYTWYKDGVVVATKTGDSTFAMAGAGNYSVSVNDAVFSQLTLYSIQNTNVQDSLALADLYTNTTGALWFKNTNWATSAPVSTWSGVLTRFGRVQQIYLPFNNLQGPLPSSLSQLTADAVLNLSNNQLSGAVPPSLGSLPALQDLELNNNSLTGSIPSTLGNLSNLETLILYTNQLTGNIPTALETLSKLTELDISNNKLTGNIPPELGNISSLEYLGLSSNQLTDTIPASLGYLNSLSEIDMNDNSLNGQIPQSVSRLKMLISLNLNNNQLIGKIPDSLCFMPQLAHLLINNNQFSGTLPDSLGNDANLIDIQMQNNNFSGIIKADLSHIFIGEFNLSGNQYNFSVLPIPINPLITNGTFIYAPQQNIPLTRTEDKLSVSAGGNSAHSTYTLFKDGTSIATQTADSLFTIVGLGNYNIVTTNTDAPLLTLYSDTLKLGLVLPDSTTTTTQSISGNLPVDLNTNIFRIVTINPGTGPNALTGSITALETVDPSIQSFDGTPYVERHYDITPLLNPSTSTATVTLYYTQADFDTYNNYVTAHSTGVPLLPTGGIDNGNILITQYHGSFTGASSPANYTQGAEVLHPTVSWDATDGWWTVTFPVNGFSGFFLGTSPSPLPLTLLQFTGAPQGYAVNLQWITTDEQNTKQFIIQHSPDGNIFDPIGTVAAKNTPTQNTYAFTDGHPNAGNNFYRLKMQDVNGQFTYSPIVQVSIADQPAAFMAYPNPAANHTSLLFTTAAASNYNIEISDPSGNVITRLAGTSSAGLNKIDIDVHNYAPGTYTITIINSQHDRQSIRLLKE